MIAEKWNERFTDNKHPMQTLKHDSVQMKSSTDQHLETCIHCDISPPIQLITNNSPIPSLLDTYLHYTKPSNVLPIH